jgi:hypothetical protein
VRRVVVLACALALAACAARHVAPPPAAPLPPPPPPPAPKEIEPICGELDARKIEPPPCADVIADVPVPPIVDPQETLAPFYEKLAALARGGDEHVRIAMYGDSNLTADWMTGHMRRVLQARFGDAGHGYVALAHPKGWYIHQDVRHGGTWSAFKPIAVSNDLTPDGHYGLANMAAETAGFGADAWVGTAREGAPIGTKASRFDLFYLKRPGGGVFDIVADGAVMKTIVTRAPAYEAGIDEIVLPEGPHELHFVTRGKGYVRYYGVAIERDAPGVVVDSLGTGAMNIVQMSWAKAETRKAMFEKRGWDLVVFHLGTTQSLLFQHKSAAKKVIAELRAALPHAALLFLTPPDFLRGRIGPDSEPRIVKVANQVREIADENGTAFWDYRAAMGGDGSMKTFIAKGLTQRDRIHLKQPAEDLMGDRLMHALFADMEGWVEKHPRTGCPAPEAVTRSE